MNERNVKNRNKQFYKEIIKIQDVSSEIERSLMVVEVEVVVEVESVAVLLQGVESSRGTVKLTTVLNHNTVFYPSFS